MDIRQFNDSKWSENVMLIDGDYVDSVAFDLIVNFERMLGRRIPNADMARWIDCIALDGGLRAMEAGAEPRETQVIFLHSKDSEGLRHFTPGRYDSELNAMAFSDSLGEFVLSAFPVEAVVSRDDFFVDVLHTVCNHKDVRRVMVVPDACNAALCESIRRTLRDVSDDKRVTLFAMQPMAGGNYRQEILGYSLMNALGIRGEELGEQ